MKTLNFSGRQDRLSGPLCALLGVELTWVFSVIWITAKHQGWKMTWCGLEKAGIKIEAGSRGGLISTPASTRDLTVTYDEQNGWASGLALKLKEAYSHILGVMTDKDKEATAAPVSSDTQVVLSQIDKLAAIVEGHLSAAPRIELAAEHRQQMADKILTVIKEPLPPPLQAASFPVPAAQQTAAEQPAAQQPAITLAQLAAAMHGVEGSLKEGFFTQAHLLQQILNRQPPAAPANAKTPVARKAAAEDAALVGASA